MNERPRREVGPLCSRLSGPLRQPNISRTNTGGGRKNSPGEGYAASA